MHTWRKRFQGREKGEENVTRKGHADEPRSSEDGREMLCGGGTGSEGESPGSRRLGSRGRRTDLSAVVRTLAFTLGEIKSQRWVLSRRGLPSARSGS